MLAVARAVRASVSSSSRFGRTFCAVGRSERKRAMENTKKALSSIPLLKTKAGPRDVDLWPQRLKEEYQSLIQVSEQQSIVVQTGQPRRSPARYPSSNRTDGSRYVRTLGLDV